MTSKAIAKALNISVPTVYKHLANIRQALEVRSSMEILTALHNTTGTSPPMIRLTPRGAEVFALIQTGMSDKSIAESLGISYSAVRRHREKMLLQNNCSTMFELLAKNISPQVKEAAEESYSPQ